MKKKLLLFIFLGFMVATQALAQTKTVTGKVTGADDKLSLPGVSVKVKGVNTAVQTNADGMYSIRVNESDVLQFSYLGYVTQDASVAGKTVLNVELVSDAQQLQEVVVTGYGVERKRDIAGAVSGIKAKDIENLPVLSFDRAMQGRMAGVQIQGNSGIPGGNVTTRIRGSGSINAGNDPLYIIDGVQMAPGDLSRSLTSQNVLAGLNPSDIESIDVLKDAASAAIYGSQAANGVIIITTKKGKSGKTQFNLRYQTGVTNPIKEVPITNGPQFLELIYEARYNQAITQGQTPTAASASASGATLTQFGYALADYGNAPTYDWQGAMNRTGINNLVELNANGGNESTTFYVSGSFEKANGQIIRSDFGRGTLRFNFDHKVSSKLKFDTKLNLSTFSQNTVPSSNSSGSTFLSAITIPSIQPIYNPDGTFATQILGTRPSNVIQSAYLNTDAGTTNQLIGSFSGTYEILKGLSFKSAFGLDYTDIAEEAYTDPRTVEGAAANGTGLAYNTRRVNWTTDQVLNYANAFGKHNVSGILGFSYRNLVDTQISAIGTDFPNGLFRTLQSAATPSDVSAVFTTYRTAGYFTKLNYTYDDRYIANVTLRYDGSSRFGADKKYGLFPAVSLAWRISGESFLKESKLIDDLKLRASWGVTGNQAIGNFDARNLFIGTGAYNGKGGINPSGLGNDLLSWEENHSVNLGLDFSLFNSRLSGAIDVFRRDSKNLLLDRPLPATSGFENISENIGSVRNEGIEFEIGGDIIRKAFSWNASANWTFLRNEVTGLNDGQDRIGTTVFLGRSIGSQYVVEFAGVNVANGRPFWYDANNNITYQPLETAGPNDARRIIGRTLPSGYGGLTNTFAYKGLELSIFFQSNFGNTLINNNSFFAERSGASPTNHTMRVYERRWRKPGDVTDWPRMYNGGPEPVNRGLASFSSRNYEKASYIRLKTVSMAYRFDSKLVSKIGFKNAAINVQGFNLWTKTGYTGYDPEVTGGDLGVYPQGKTITAGIQLGF